jgi:hypothetical protein
VRQHSGEFKPKQIIQLLLYMLYNPLAARQNAAFFVVSFIEIKPDINCAVLSFEKHGPAFHFQYCINRLRISNTIPLHPAMLNVLPKVGSKQPQRFVQQTHRIIIQNKTGCH